MNKIFFAILMILIALALPMPAKAELGNGLTSLITSSDGKTWSVSIANDGSVYQGEEEVSLEFGAFWCNRKTDQSCDDNSLDYRGKKMLETFSFTVPAKDQQTKIADKTFSIPQACGTVQADISLLETGGSTEGAVKNFDDSCLISASLSQKAGACALLATWDVGLSDDPRCQIKIVAGTNTKALSDTHCNGSWDSSQPNALPAGLSIHDGGEYTLYAGVEGAGPLSLDCPAPPPASPPASPPATTDPLTLRVTCSASSPTANINQKITWSAEVKGGVDPIAYSWSGDDGLGGTTSSISHSYSTGGVKSATIRVTDSSTPTHLSAQNSCSVPISIPGSIILSARPICSGGPAAFLEWQTLSGVTSYDIYRNNSNSKSATISGSGTLQYTDNNLSANTSYNYQVKAGTSQSNLASITTTSCTSGKDITFKVTASTSCAASAATQNVTVSWTDAQAYHSYKPHMRVVYVPGVTGPCGLTACSTLINQCIRESQSLSSYTFALSGINADSRKVSLYEVGVTPHWASDSSCPGGICSACSTPSGTVYVSIPPALCVAISAPTVNIRANNSNGPVTVNAGSLLTLTWTTANSPTDCTASGSWSGTKSPTSGNENITGLVTAANKTYTLTCTNSAGSAQDSVIVNVVVPDRTVPQAQLSGTFLGCYNPDSWVKAQPIQATATDNQGVSAVIFKLTNLTTTNQSNTFPAVYNAISERWQKLFVNKDLTDVGGTGHQYKLQVQATDRSTNSSSFDAAAPATFLYKTSCEDITPWIQTTGGDVHANTSISTPGGPGPSPGP